MNKPHKHAELIKAWADGAEIEYQRPNETTWRDCLTPSWIEDFSYRIKPEEKKPVVRWLWATKDGHITGNLYTEDEIKVINDYKIKLEWSRTEFPE